ncbi:metallophosphoesterase [Pseudonocardia parietis]|uniref:3',5'-cyclic AMP phosphodiesterase CpdA n=1 Tax=Pseudonocardia parietis TaxID=570936 RepID=A0ABS4VTN8_9PSEU|nr:metallophosphoesterase [Pseudonocardia parietis]MBP2367292.1 3',5'-cyclic AMP phosphodiesterase CpdA [Pseudonocardia parietis]
MLTVAQLTDIHVGVAGNAERAERALAGVRSLGADLVLVTGDIAEHGTAGEYALAADLLSDLDAWLVPGNHDDRDAMTAAFGPVSDRVHRAGGATVVLLDSLVDGELSGSLSAAGLDLLADAVRDPAPLLVALHHPPVPVGHPFMDGIRLTDPEPFEALLASRADPTLVVCGHVHRPMATTFAGHPLVVAPSVAPGVRFPEEPGEEFVLPGSVPGGVVHVLGDGPPRSRFVTWPGRIPPGSAGPLG